MQNSMIAVSCMVLQGVVNTFGETVMAAYTCIGRIEQVVQQPYMSLGSALTTYSGQNMGAGQIDRVKKGFRQGTVMVLIFSMCLLPIAYLFGEQIVGIFVNDPEVIAIGAKAIRINSLCYFGLGMIYVPRSVLNGCGDTGFAMINGITEVICRVVFSLILTSIPLLGYWGIWMTTGLTWALTGVVCVIRYLTGNWRTKSIVRHA
jgi:Na+-driven multidrug efflux pump